MAFQCDANHQSLPLTTRMSTTTDLEPSTTASLPPFRYQSLHFNRFSIRLVKFSEVDGTIVGSLRHTYNISKYTAISYVWGSPWSRTPVPITINGTSFFVRPNLHALLLELCRRKCKDELWIDAICINQSDIRERNSQVSRMADIYKKAQQVYYWLGQGDHDMQECLYYFLDCARGRVTPDAWLREDGFRHDYYKQARHICTLSSTKQGDISRGLRKLPAVEYWRRSWTVQEVLISSKKGIILLGPISISYPHFTAIYESVRRLAFSSHGPIPSGLTVHIEDSYFWKFLEAGWNLRPDGTLTFEEILAKFGKTQCSDMRDRIYAFRAITESSSRTSVDYGITIEGLFCQVAASVDGDDPGRRGYILRLLVRALEINEDKLRDTDAWYNLDPHLQAQISEVFDGLQKFPGG